MSGKGSRPRPISVSNEEYNNRWDAIFARDVQKFDEAVFKNEEQEILNNETLERGPSFLLEKK